MAFGGKSFAGGMFADAGAAGPLRFGSGTVTDYATNPIRKVTDRGTATSGTVTDYGSGVTATVTDRSSG